MSEKKYDLIYVAVEKSAISKKDADDLVRGYFSQIPYEKTDPKGREIVADKIIQRYASLAAATGGLTSLVGVVPGVGTAASLVGGGWLM
ncbi:MAG: hypothetical protein Q4G13_03865 [Moraxella sp.]|nr:hypothetical protein [Moraxella sp.]